MSSIHAAGRRIAAALMVSGALVCAVPAGAFAYPPGPAVRASAAGAAGLVSPQPIPGRWFLNPQPLPPKAN